MKKRAEEYRSEEQAVRDHTQHGKKIVSIIRYTTPKKKVLGWEVNYEDGSMVEKKTSELGSDEHAFLAKGIVDMDVSEIKRTIIRNQYEMQTEQLLYLTRLTGTELVQSEILEYDTQRQYVKGEVIKDGRAIYTVWAEDKTVVVDNLWRFLKDMRYGEF